MKTSFAPGLTFLAALFFFALASAVPARALDAGAVAAVKRDLQAAVNHGDLAGILAARARFAALSAAEPDQALLHEWVAVATWRALPLETSKDPKTAERMGDDALDRLEKVLAANPKDGEALALKGGIQGLLIGVKPNSMMTLGPQSGASIARAVAVAPASPRAALLEGITNLHKPAQFGGGADAALPSFERAETLYAKESIADSAAMDWGRDDAFLWEGQTHAQKKEWAAACNAYRRALEANPANGWVRNVLLPQAENERDAAKPAGPKSSPAGEAKASKEK